MATTADVLVLGTGGVGSAIINHLARRGVDVIGLDRFAPAHDRGSSHGHTRIIRTAYFEHPNYVPLLFRSYELWRELEQRSQRTLYWETGLIETGPPQGAVIPGVLASAKQHQLPIDQLTPREAQQRWPGFLFPESHHVVYEQQAGQLYVEACVQAHLDEAVHHGAQHVPQTPVVSWQAESGAVHVRTERGDYSAGQLIIASGSWTADLLSDLDLPLQVVRKHLHWYANDSVHLQADHGCPAYFYDIDDRYFYGMPQCDDRGVKVGEHSSGEQVKDPTNVDRTTDPDDIARVEGFLANYLPPLSNRRTDHAVCMYTRTPDEHFIVDQHPEHDHVHFVAGLSGHGFKFTAVLGEVMADLAVNGHSSHPIDFFRLDRFDQ